MMPILMLHFKYQNMHPFFVLNINSNYRLFANSVSLPIVVLGQYVIRQFVFWSNCFSVNGFTAKIS